jgi:hypothetical protein
MRRTGYFCTAAVAVLMLAALANAQGPPPAPMADASFDVSLHLVLGSNEGGRGDLPNELSAVTKQMRSNFGFSNYRVASTFLGRISNSGSFEYKSVSNIFGQQSIADSQTFLEWSLGDFHTVPSAGGGQAVQARAFRFGARVPVVFAPAGGDKAAPIQYESIGVNVGRFVVAQNTPTLIGTLNLPGTAGTIFLVMTVRLAD